MKHLIAILAVAMLLLFGCAGNQGVAAGGASGGTGQNAAGGTPSGGQAAPSGGGQPSGGVSSGQIVPGSNVSDTEAVKEFTIEASNWKFTPSTITVNKGDRVKITLKNVEGVHGIAIPELGVDVKCGMGESKSVEFTASKEGTFEFRCSVFCGEGHREMKGTLVVVK